MWKIVIQSIILILLSYPLVSALNNFCGFIVAKLIKTPQYKLVDNLNKKVTIIVPAHNEEIEIGKTLDYLCTKLTYKYYDVIVVNDNSSDQTQAIIDQALNKYNNLKCIELKVNFGKSKVLNLATTYTNAEFILVCDADTVMQVDAIEQYLKYFINNPSMGAVSGNISIKSNKKLIENSQVLEFSNLIGFVKRTQQHVFSKIFTLSGANAFYRKKALYDVGMFRTDRHAEDISVTWDLQIRGWKTHFAPNVMFYTGVPTSWTQLFKQRLRWAIGGMEVWVTNTLKIWRHPLRYLGLIAIWIDSIITFIWTISFFILLYLFIIDVQVLTVTKLFVNLANLISYILIFVNFQILLGLSEIILSVLIEHKKVKWSYIFYAPLYILFYWVINPLTIIFAVVPTLKSLILNKEVSWISPKR